MNPQTGRITVRIYATDWLAHRSTIRPRTRELYDSLLRHHILPTLGDTALAALTPRAIRTWHTRLVNQPRPGAVTVAKMYRLLRTILNTAVEDGVIARNPCVIKGAGVERSPERPTATIEQVYRLADEVDPRHRLVVLLATFTSHSHAVDAPVELLDDDGLQIWTTILGAASVLLARLPLAEPGRSWHIGDVARQLGIGTDYVQRVVRRLAQFGWLDATEATTVRSSTTSWPPAPSRRATWSGSI